MKKRGRIVAFFLIVIVFLGTIGTTVTGVAKDTSLGLDLQGGFEVLYEVEPLEEGQEVSRSLLEGTVETLNNRVNSLGISEATINIEGDNRIRVQLAGVENQQEAKEILGTSAQLSFRDVNDNKLLDGTDVVEGSASQDFDPNTNSPIVTLQLEDASQFGQVTDQISQMPPPDNSLVIWMDYQEGDSYTEEVQQENPKFISAPSVSEPLYTSEVMISGNFTVESAQQMADLINSGSLPVQMNEIFSTSVGAQFGEQALNETVLAGIIGIGLILLFMIAVYRLPGLVAAVTLVFYTYLVLLTFNLMNGVLTLSGIAGLILGIGMAVDANVITFERIKEELRAGKSVKASFKAGTKNSFRAILDANLTTLIAAGTLFVFGTSSVQGFATMLIISILVSFITAVWLSRVLLGLLVKSGFLNKRKGWFGVKKKDIKDSADATEEEPKLFNRKLNLVKHRKKYFTISIVTFVVGIGSMLFLQFNPGIDFTSGSRVQVPADSSLTTEEVQSSFEELGLEPASVVISGENDDLGVVRFERVLSQAEVGEVQQLFNERYGSTPSVSVVSPIVGQELVKNAIYSLIVAIVLMVIYVTFRFEFHSAVSAVVAMVSDMFLILTIFSLVQLEFDTTIVTALLTTAGYAINNTVVIFDRLRENLQKEQKVTSYDRLATIVNRSALQSMTRTINTGVTTLIGVLAFMIIGAEAIRGFAFAMTIGLISGIFTAQFLAPQIWLAWRGRRLKKKPIDYTKKEQIGGPQV